MLKLNMLKNKTFKRLINLFYEWGVLKVLPRSGWLYIGIRNPETVAEHSLRAAQIGYVLARLVNYPEPEKVAAALVFHEIGETRVGDLNLLSLKYLPKQNELNAIKDQIKDLLPEIYDWVKALENREGRLGKILKDADLLENALTAREYIEQGHTQARQWLENIEKRLQTKTGKKIFQEIIKSSPYSWYKDSSR